MASSTLMYKPYVGTTRYRAPEILQGRYTRTVDVYAFALVCYQILTGLEPFLHLQNLHELREKVRNGARPQCSRLFHDYCDYPPNFLRKLTQLIEACWNGDATKRPGFTKICLELHHIKNYLLTGSYVEGFTDSTIEEVKSHSMTSSFRFADSERVAHRQLDSHLSKLQSCEHAGCCVTIRRVLLQLNISIVDFCLTI